MATTVDEVINEMQDHLPRLGKPHHRYFLGTYQRTTAAIGKAVDGAAFEDPDWVERWDVAFARLYLDALDAYQRAAYQSDAYQRDGSTPRPWQLAFDADPALPPLRHVLLGINAHVNYDLPQALLAVITDDDFHDDQLMARRRRDHERIDGVLASRVAAEDHELLAAGGARSLLDRLLTPLNRLGSRRFLREARQKVWHNTAELQHARADSAERYAGRLAELELLSAAKIADLLAPGQVILRLAVAGFGVVLPPPANGH